jgi:hypothetical protein
MASPAVRIDAVKTFRVSAGRFTLFHVVSRITTAGDGWCPEWPTRSMGQVTALDAVKTREQTAGNERN